MRLAGVSALLTFVILCAFAIGIGSLTVHRIREDFNRDVLTTADQIAAQLTVEAEPFSGKFRITPPLKDIDTDGTVIRVTTLGGSLIEEQPAHSPAFGPPQEKAMTTHGYRVISVAVLVTNSGVRLGKAIVEYGRPVAGTEATVKRVELFLLVGVLGGSLLALFAGMAIARRAMAPITELTSTAAEIARTRDPSLRIPQSEADDEVSELARTLEGMLRELDAARGETESMLARQRRFVADASHELRTPLTSVLANLELLAESLHGDQGEAATSALRSSRRMRRLVADLLLLARNDASRVTPREVCDLGQILVEATAELGPVSESHEISLDVHPAHAKASRDDLHRVAINLLENALRHTPPGTHIRASSATLDDGLVELVVEDDGPGVPPEMASTLFERFVRGAGGAPRRDGVVGGSFGLGLAIVQAVAQAHGGSVTLERSTLGEPGQETGARFVVRLPEAADSDEGSETDTEPQALSSQRAV
jgi:two-component system OmpR family sensor kinase